MKKKNRIDITKHSIKKENQKEEPKFDKRLLIAILLVVINLVVFYVFANTV